MTRRPCSWLSTLTVAVSSRSSPPADAQAVRVPDEGDGAAVEQGVDPGEDAVEPLADLAGGLPAGAAVGPEVPARVVVVDVGRGAPLVVAVVPLGQVVVGPADVEAGELGGVQRPDAGAGQDGGEAPTGKEPAEGVGLPLTVGGERQVGVRGVPAAGAPGGLAVPDQQDLSHPPSQPDTRHSRSPSILGCPRGCEAVGREQPGFRRKTRGRTQARAHNCRAGAGAEEAT
jgi:hypothetical protein